MWAGRACVDPDGEFGIPTPDDDATYAAHLAALCEMLAERLAGPGGTPKQRQSDRVKLALIEKYKDYVWEARDGSFVPFPLMTERRLRTCIAYKWRHWEDVCKRVREARTKVKFERRMARGETGLMGQAYGDLAALSVDLAEMEPDTDLFPGDADLRYALFEAGLVIQRNEQRAINELPEIHKLLGEKYWCLMSLFMLRHEALKRGLTNYE